MIRKIVMWKLSGDTEAERTAYIKRVRQTLFNLRRCIPGMRHLENDVDFSQVDYACDVVLVSEFESQASLDAYAVHLEQLQVRDELACVRIRRYQVDHEVASDAASVASTA